MLMHLTIVMLFIITATLSFFEERIQERDKIIILSAYVFFMIFLATTKDIEHTADALTYNTYFLRNDHFFFVLILEPTFIYLSRFVLALGGTVVAMFFIYASISIPSKIWTLSRLTPYIFTALLIYIPVYFELHDMIQIRVAAAGGFLMLSLIPITQKRYLLASILILCGISFHYSSGIYLPFLFIGNRKFNRIIRILLAIILSLLIVVNLLKSDLLSLLPSSLMQGRVDFYKEATEKGNFGTEFSPFYMIYVWIKSILLYLILYYYDLIAEKNRYAPLLISLFTASIFLVYSLSSLPVISGRLSELYGIIDGIVFTFLIYIIQPAYAAKAIIVAVGGYMILYAMLFTEYFT